jgi:hypothetical protein
MHLKLTCEVRGFGIVHCILESLRMMTVACCLILSHVPSVRDFDSVTLLFSCTPVPGMCHRTVGLCYQNHERKVHETKPDKMQ